MSSMHEPSLGMVGRPKWAQTLPQAHKDHNTCAEVVLGLPHRLQLENSCGNAGSSIEAHSHAS